MKNLMLLICLLSSFSAKCDLPSLILCLGEFKTSEGAVKSYYFNISSDYLYLDGDINARNKVLNLNELNHGSTEIFINYYDFNCGKMHIFGIDKNDVIENSKLDLNTVKVKYVVFKTMFGYIGIINDEIMAQLKMGQSNCSNFDIDIIYQDQGGDSIETYFLFSNNKKADIKDIINEIKLSYSKHRMLYLENDYGNNHKLYRAFVKDKIQSISNIKVAALIHYK